MHCIFTGRIGKNFLSSLLFSSLNYLSYPGRIILRWIFRQWDGGCGLV
jgi:hypothetical protein